MTETPFTAVIVDDEPLAVEGVRRLCASAGGVTIVGEAHDGHAALDLIARVRPQAVFLDIAMPGMSGLEVATALRDASRSLQVVLVTANDNFATEAYDLAVVDYVLKPIDPARLFRAIARVADLIGRTDSAVEADDALWVPYRGTVTRLPISAIRRLDAERDYVRVSDAERTYLVRGTISDFVDRLTGAGFIRIHRSTAFALSEFISVRHVGGGAWVAIDSAGVETAIGRTYLPSVRAALGLSS